MEEEGVTALEFFLRLHLAGYRGILRPDDFRFDEQTWRMTRCSPKSDQNFTRNWKDLASRKFPAAFLGLSRQFPTVPRRHADLAQAGGC
jgi:hypothetical protein